MIEIITIRTGSQGDTFRWKLGKPVPFRTGTDYGTD